MLALPRKISTPIFGYALFSVILLALFSSLYISSHVVIHSVSSAAKRSQLTATSPQIKISAIGIPIRLRIPTLNIDAAIESVGLTPDGVMDIKKNQNNTAWYKFGPRPGNQGSAVIAGHYGWDHEKASVFTQLSKLQKGDALYVDSDTRVSVAFVVREMKRYKPDANAITVFNSSDGGSHLNLITCDGSWNEASKTYDNRLVVFTDRV